ncbi:glycoside hydrolase family 2 protein [Demequina oxidasica]|uniref:glycoside hydrolase family 2 protein n=1 Tax=Demequina oxidasica TaxID=676199 RepID=UPI000785BB5D|nr:hypothetical protein [Demequina oxidasica]
MTRDSSATTREALTIWRLFLGADSESAPAGVTAALTEGIPATVPGSVLGTLIEAGLASDVTVDGLEEDVAWATHCTWIYRTSVPRLGDGAHVTIDFEGVDTLATVRVDGNSVLETDDMFHAWSIELTDDAHHAHPSSDDTGDSAVIPALSAGKEWSVEVEFHPVLPVANALEASDPLPRADMYEIPFNQVRKMACSFGWDWGPTTITAGLWRGATVTRRCQASIDQLLLTTDWSNGASLSARLDIEGTADAVVATVVPAGGGEALASQRFDVAHGHLEFDLQVPQARRWDVVDRGDQPLYDVHISVVDDSGAELDSTHRRVGFRHVSLVQDEDDIGRSFEVHVNGARVWARGFNWIPADVLPERVTRERTRELVQEAVDTGANMLRIWGGGVVESRDFFEACDEAGVLVWQDFSFACAAYAEDDAQMMRVQREVADAVRRVGHHASLALWCGCNENLWGFEDWGWKETLGEDGVWGAHLYHEVIPKALAELDPRRPYIPGSPFSPDDGVHPNDPTQGTTHHWDTWNQLDYTAFEDKTSRFASEFGWQAPAAWHTLTRAMGSEPTSGDDPRLQRLQKHPEGKAGLARGIADHVAHLPTDGRGWYFATQLMQARAISASIGRFRSLHESCSGTLWWQLNDCWPALSWAVVDVTGARKLGWYASAQIMAPRAIIATSPQTPHALTVVNDVPQTWEAMARIRTVTESGDVLLDERIGLHIAADGHAEIAPSRLPQGTVAVVVDVEDKRAVRWLVADDALEHPAASLASVQINPDAASDVVRVTVVAKHLIRDLSLLAETHPALEGVRVDRQLLTLLPGEAATFTVTRMGGATLAAYEWRSLLCAGTALVMP